MGELQGAVGGILAVLLLTGFVRYFTALSILRVGLGVRGGGFGLIVGAVAVALALVAATPQLTSLQADSLGGLVRLFSAPGSPAALSQVEEAFRPILAARAEGEVLARFEKLGRRTGGPSGASATESVSVDQRTPFSVLVGAYVVSELREAFRVGLLFLLPFVVIDLVIVNVMAALSVPQARPETVALAVKLLLFIAVDGWGLVAGRLLGIGA